MSCGIFCFAGFHLESVAVEESIRSLSGGHFFCLSGPGGVRGHLWWQSGSRFPDERVVRQTVARSRPVLWDYFCGLGFRDCSKIKEGNPKVRFLKKSPIPRTRVFQHGFSFQTISLSHPRFLPEQSSLQISSVSAYRFVLIIS